MMKTIILSPLIFVVCLLAFTGTAFSQTGKALILVDEPFAPGTAAASQRTLENLLGHFDLAYDVKTVDSYAAGDVDRYQATFYLGSTFDRALPPVFLQDVLATNSRVVWISYNIWKAAWDYQAQFESRFGFRFIQELGTGNFKKVNYGGQTFVRTQSDYGQLSILNAAKASTKATITNGTKSRPYVIQSGNFWYVADDPMSQGAEDSPYLAFCDLLHDMLGIQHAASHKALVRIEDIDATEDPARIRAIADYLYSESVPFSLAVIPSFRDPLGAWGPPMTKEIYQSPELVSALNYAVTKGGTIIMHGYTHQYGTVANPTNGVSGVDSEFYIQQTDATGQINDIGPVPEDSPAWVQGRIDSGLGILQTAGFARPRIWETPHYLAADADYPVFTSNFDAIYERFDYIYFPYIINRTEYGGRLIPENLGYISGTDSPPSLLINRAGKNLAIRDGFASFFFHSEENINDLKATVAGIKAKGFTFVDVNMLMPAADTTAPEIIAHWPDGTIYGDANTVYVRYADYGGSGIDPATGVSVTLDGKAMSGCTVTDELVGCPYQGLASGVHQVGGSATDRAGNAAAISFVFTIADTTAPEIIAHWPDGTIYGDANTVYVRYADYGGSGIDPATGVSVTLDGKAMSGCTVTDELVGCPYQGLASGVHQVGGSATDRAGNAAAIGFEFTIG